ncbi:MAG: tetratricopeptide repeat protein, partial [Gammaproteobacteria bacterium]|nr:tetratricopeptide repeat protein [Gammaproteobacteria bacterium]
MKWTRTLDDQDMRSTVNALNTQMPSQPLQMSNNASVSQPGTSLSFTSLWQLPAKLSVFTGRKQPLSELTNLFLRSTNQLLIQQAPQITGTGGIGKTQLAIQFVHQLLVSGHIKTVIWLNADTSGVDQINIEFLRLARALGIDTKPLDQAGIVRCVYHVLSQQPKVLVVFDSATRYEDVIKYCPPDNSPIRLLVTTRDDHRWAEQFSQCPLSIFSLEEAVEYISKVLVEPKVSREDAEKLAVCLGCFPLALAQAIGYILTRNIDINTYIELYESKKTTRKKLLDTRPLSEDLHQETLWIAVSLSLERIENLNTQNIIAALSYMAPEMPITGDFVETWTQETAQNQQAIRAMRQFGIISTEKGTRSIRIHQMVQEVIRLNHDEIAKQNILAMLVSKLFTFLSVSTNPLEHENRLIVMMAHALSVNTMLASHDCFNDLGMMLKLACLEIRVVEAKKELGQNQEALKHGLMALEILDSVPEFDQGYAATLISHIGLCYQNIGKAEEALPYHVRAQKIFESKYEGNDIVSATGTINVAGCYYLLGQVQKAHEILSSLLPKLEKVSNLSINVLLINLSSTFRELGDSENAINLLKRGLEAQRKIYGDDHPEIAIILNNLCAIYAELDQSLLALPLIEKALAINEERFGKDHLEVAKTLDIMGNVYCGAGLPQEAKNVLKRALNIRVQQLGAQHPQVALTKFNLANAIMDLADTNEAKVLLDEALLIQQQYYGGYSPEAGRTLHILGNAYHDQGNLDKAIESMTLAIKILERNFGAEHRELAKVYNDISCIYLDRRLMLLARESGENALRIFEKTLGPDHIEVARTLNNLANMCRVEKQLHKALS